MPKKTRSEKEAIVRELREKFGSQKGAVLTRMSGLSVAEATDLRRKIKEAGGELKVTKISLLKLASQGSPFEPLVRDMTGTTALVFAYDDPVAVAKAFKGFTEKVPKLEPLSGVLGDKTITAQEVLTIADLPSKEELIAKLARTLAAPLSGFVTALSGIPQRLVYALNAVKLSKEEK